MWSIVGLKEAKEEKLKRSTGRLFHTLTSCVGGMPPQYAPVPCELTFDLLTLKVVSDVMWATSVPILVFLGLSVLDLGPMYATDRQTDIQTDVRRQTRIIA